MHGVPIDIGSQCFCGDENCISVSHPSVMQLAVQVCLQHRHPAAQQAHAGRIWVQIPRVPHLLSHAGLRHSVSGKHACFHQELLYMHCCHGDEWVANHACWVSIAMHCSPLPASSCDAHDMTCGHLQLASCWHRQRMPLALSNCSRCSRAGNS